MTPEIQQVQDLSEQEQIRRAKLAKYQEEGRDPYTITRFDRTHTSAQILADFDALEGKTVRIAGRMMSRRIMGKASFVHMLDGDGQIQAYVRREDVGEDVYADFKTMDIGDIIGVEGVVFRTKTGEVSVHAHQLTLLTKSLRVLPEKWNGLKDQDIRYRQRYVDTIVNPEVKDTFIKRSQILKALREFLDARGFLEVDTPVLQTIEIGANSRSFVTHHNALDIPMYLRIETELYLKRLIVGGFDKVYEVGRIFRNEGMDTRHNPEFTTIELYQAYADYHQIMNLVEELYIYVTKKVCGTLKIPYLGKEINMEGPWARMTMAEAVKKYSGIDYYAWESDEQARADCEAHDVHVEKDAVKGQCLEECFDAFVEPNLIQPTFITDYPVAISPLAKRKKDEPEMTERFEFFINGDKVGDNFLDPAWSDYDKIVCYVPFDVTDRLQQGANVLGVMLGNGMYNVPRERYYKLLMTYGYPMMICKVDVEYADGTHDVIVSDGSWRTTTSPVTYSSIFGGEDYDATLERTGWMKPGYDDSSWQEVLFTSQRGELIAPKALPVKVMEEFPVFKIRKTKYGKWLYDMGQNFSGVARLTVKGKRGQAVRMNTCELFDPAVPFRATDDAEHTCRYCDYRQICRR